MDRHGTHPVRQPSTGSVYTWPVAGTVVIIVLLVLVFPVLFLMSMAALAALLGSLLKRDVDAAHEGSELLALSNRPS